MINWSNNILVINWIFSETVLAKNTNNMAYKSRKKGVLSLQNNTTVHNFFYMVIKKEAQWSTNHQRKKERN